MRPRNVLVSSSVDTYLLLSSRAAVSYWGNQKNVETIDSLTVTVYLSRKSVQKQLDGSVDNF